MPSGWRRALSLVTASTGGRLRRQRRYQGDSPAKLSPRLTGSASILRGSRPRAELALQTLERPGSALTPGPVLRPRRASACGPLTDVPEHRRPRAPEDRIRGATITGLSGHRCAPWPHRTGEIWSADQEVPVGVGSLRCRHVADVHSTGCRARWPVRRRAAPRRSARAAKPVVAPAPAPWRLTAREPVTRCPPAAEGIRNIDRGTDSGLIQGGDNDLGDLGDALQTPRRQRTKTRAWAASMTGFQPLQSSGDIRVNLGS